MWMGLSVLPLLPSKARSQCTFFSRRTSHKIPGVRTQGIEPPSNRNLRSSKQPFLKIYEYDTIHISKVLTYRIKLSKLPVKTVSGRPKHETFGLSSIGPVDSDVIILISDDRKPPITA